MAKEIKTEIQIAASSEKVWAILTDFEAYPTWNPFIKSLTGEVKVGNTITARIEPPNAKGMTFKPKVLVAEKNRQFEWQGHLLFPGIFDGKHKFKIEEINEGSCTLFHEEEFGGILSFIYNTENAQKSFVAMNEALRKLLQGL